MYMYNDDVYIMIHIVLINGQYIFICTYHLSVLLIVLFMSIPLSFMIICHHLAIHHYLAMYHDLTIGCY